MQRVGSRCILISDEGEQTTMVQSKVIHRTPEILGGTPVFLGTRVPAQALIDYFEEGRSLDEFLEDFPTVKRGQATEALEDLKKILLG